MLIDTLQASERLKEGDFDEERARAIVDLWRMGSARVATKEDLELMEIRLNRNVHNWVAGVGGMIALLMAIFEFIGA